MPPSGVASARELLVVPKSIPTTEFWNRRIDPFSQHPATVSEPGSMDIAAVVIDPKDQPDRTITSRPQSASTRLAQTYERGFKCYFPSPLRATVLFPSLLFG